MTIEHVTQETIVARQDGVVIYDVMSLIARHIL